MDYKDKDEREKVEEKEAYQLSHKPTEILPMGPIRDWYVPSKTYEVAQWEDQEYAEQKVDFIFELRYVFIKVLKLYSESVD